MLFVKVSHCFMVSKVRAMSLGLHAAFSVVFADVPSCDFSLRAKLCFTLSCLDKACQLFASLHLIALFKYKICSKWQSLFKKKKYGLKKVVCILLIAFIMKLKFTYSSSHPLYFFFLPCGTEDCFRICHMLGKCSVTKLVISSALSCFIFLGAGLINSVAQAAPT